MGGNITPFFNKSYNMIQQNLISVEEAKVIQSNLNGGEPTTNRIVISVPKDDARTSSGLIIPGKDNDSIPKRGVIVQMGPIDQDEPISNQLHIGDVITYGLYAGKELDFLNTGYESSQKFMVLSITEVIYIQSNVN